MTNLKSLPPAFTSDQAAAFASDLFSIEVQTIESLGSFIDQNFRVISTDGAEYTLKIHDGEEQRPVIDLQSKTAGFLSEQLTSVQFPVANQAVDGSGIVTVQDKQGISHFVRLLNYIPGLLLKDVPIFSEPLLRKIGELLGQMDSALQNFSHVAANRPDLPWDLKNASAIGQLSSHIKDPHNRRIAEYFFLQFDTEVARKLVTTRKSIVHNDSHRYSLLVDKDQTHISGVIDFGDTVYTHTICNLAIALSDIMVQCVDPIGSAAIVVGRYHKQFELTEDEVSLLYYLICTRLSIYGCMSAVASESHPENHHAQIKTQQVWELLDRLLAVNPLDAEQQFRSACNMRSLSGDRQSKADANIKLRNRYFPKSLYTHYQQPVSLYKGALQYLYDEDGRTYLDCVNNVCQWGHCHPRIVRAAQQQIAGLNTNSRYIYPQMTEYADRLLSTFPESLDVCFFVNSGSEANDLAMRLARTYTGNKDLLVIDKAYHGNSSVCTDISPNRIDREGGPGLPSHVHSTLIPDTFRGAHLADDSQATEKYVADIRRITTELAEQGRGMAAFYAESLVGTGGQIVLPAGYLQAAYKIIRDAGGICIADEVQVGFARTGENVWCFESQQVVPDIVTLGKPIGNGHPMAAVITTRAIADAFDNGITYFNTFGGNPVSCATGLAVLDVLEDEQLQENVRRMSALLFEGLDELKTKHPLIADIRGQGLYIGVELISDREKMIPATAEAKKVVELAKVNGVLLNTNGYDNNIIKIKPPLIINEADVLKIINTLDQVFSEL